MIGLVMAWERQSRTIRRLLRIIDKQTGRIAVLERERDEARADAELMLGLVPDHLKRDACALVRTRHQIVNQPERAVRRAFDQEAG